ncbi:hypothetical protein FPOAC2_09825 [Fusarium poae]
MDFLPEGLDETLSDTSPNTMVDEPITQNDSSEFIDPAVLQHLDESHSDTNPDTMVGEPITQNNNSAFIDPAVFESLDEFLLNTSPDTIVSKSITQNDGPAFTDPAVFEHVDKSHSDTNPDTMVGEPITQNDSPQSIEETVLKQVLPSNLIGDKIFLIHEIDQKRGKNTRSILTNKHFAVLLYMPKESLTIRPSDRYLDLVGIYRTIDDLHDSSFWDTSDIPPLGETQECLQYDNDRCIITGFGASAPCRIIPFTRGIVGGGPKETMLSGCPLVHNLLGFSKINLAGYRNANPDVEPRSDLDLDRLRAEMKRPTSCWNMITLSPDLRKMWAEGMFGLKWVGASQDPIDKDKVWIVLQFVWMPMNNQRKRDDEIKLYKNEPYKLGDELQHTWGNKTRPLVPCLMDPCIDCENTERVAAYYINNGVPVRSGDLFSITRARNDESVCRYAFELQWILVCAHAISGLD